MTYEIAVVIIIIEASATDDWEKQQSSIVNLFRNCRCNSLSTRCKVATLAITSMISALQLMERSKVRFSITLLISVLIRQWKIWILNRSFKNCLLLRKFGTVKAYYKRHVVVWTIMEANFERACDVIPTWWLLLRCEPLTRCSRLRNNRMSFRWMKPISSECSFGNVVSPCKETPGFR